MKSSEVAYESFSFISPNIALDPKVKRTQCVNC